MLAVILESLSQLAPLLVLPSQAEPASNPLSAPPGIVAQQRVAKAIQPNSFVTGRSSSAGPAVVRIDTERTLTRRIPDPLLEDPFFRRFFGDNFHSQCLLSICEV